MEPSSSFYIWAIKIKGQKPCEKTPRARTCVCVCVCVRLFFCCFFLPLKCYAVNRRRRRRARAREPNVRSSVSFAVAVVCFGWSRRGGCLSKGWRCRRLGGGGARTVLITCSRSKPFWVRPRRGPAAGPGRCRRPRRRLRSWAVSWLQNRNRERERERAVNFEVGIITDRLLPLVTTIDSTLFFIVTSWYHNAGRWLKPIRKTSCSLLKGTVKVVERLKNNKRLSSSHTRCYYRSLLTAGLRLSAIKR